MLRVPDFAPATLIRLGQAVSITERAVRIVTASGRTGRFRGHFVMVVYLEVHPPPPYWRLERAARGQA